MRSRHDVRRALSEALEPLAFVRAAWEGGSTAFGRDDEHSDLDLQVLVRDGAVERAFAAVEDALIGLGGISQHYRMPEPTWHGHSQAFYRLTEGAPYLVIDLVVMEESAPGRFLTRERHGEPQILFDRTGDIRAVPMDLEDQRTIVTNRLRGLESIVPMFSDFVDKELERNNPIGALVTYHAFVMRPLVELLGIRHCPHRFDYGSRYAVHEFPAKVVERLERLWFVAGAGELPARRAEAEAWFGETLREIEAAGIDL